MRITEKGKGQRCEMWSDTQGKNKIKHKAPTTT